jgi:Lrp/AsnC family transcriptional regulator
LYKLDDLDRQILEILQEDGRASHVNIAKRLGVGHTRVRDRIIRMEQAGVITGRVALADPAKLGCPLEVIVMIRAGRHDAEWLDGFHTAVRTMSEVVGAYRMTGDLDYLLRVRVADVPAYDAFYKRVIARIPLSDISASFVMEDIKETTALPV